MAHIPVMLDETLKYLNVKEDGMYIDGTLGGGSHSEAILKQLTSGFLYGFDQDEEAIQRTKNKLAPYKGKVDIIQSNFEFMKEALEQRNIHGVDGILLDLGVSSFHFDDENRGFTYRKDAPLDMRMDLSNPTDAKTILNTYAFKALRQILFEYGEEKFAPKIASNIVKRREEKPIETTHELVDIIKSSMPQKVLSKKGHPAKKTFQALRIAVNDELGVLKRTIDKALSLLNPEGRLVIITFHSLEDRIVKKAFKKAATIDHPKDIPVMPSKTPDFELLHRKVITPSETELNKNNRSHSAKLRAIRKVNKNTENE